MQNISIIVPTYNERDNVVTLVERVHRALTGYSYRLLFIDDDSKDGTAELARSLAEKYPVDVVVRKGKRGLASAVVDGIGVATGDTIVVMDADLQHPPEVITALLKEIENGADIVIPSRYIKGGGCEGWGLVRRIISKGAISLAHLLLPTTRCFTDPASGFFAFKRQVVANADLKPTGYKILLEILVQGKFQKTAEVPYIFKTRGKGESKLNARQQVEFLRHLYSLMRRTGEWLRFLKFCLVGLSGVVVNVGILWLLTELAGLQYLISAAVGIELSIISNFTLNNLFTFCDRRSPSTGATFVRLLKFNLVSLAGLGLNMSVLWVLTEVAGIYYIISNLCGIAVAALWNYVFSTLWTWR